MKLSTFSPKDHSTLPFPPVTLHLACLFCEHCVLGRLCPLTKTTDLAIPCVSFLGLQTPLRSSSAGVPHCCFYQQGHRGKEQQACYLDPSIFRAMFLLKLCSVPKVLPLSWDGSAF